MKFFEIKDNIHPIPEIQKFCQSLTKKYNLAADYRSFPIPITNIILSNSYYKDLKRDLEKFLEIMYFAVDVIKKEPTLAKNFFLEDYLSKLEFMKKCPFIRLDIALTPDGPKVFEINARHPFGPGGHLVFEAFDLFNNTDLKYVEFKLEEEVAKYFKKNFPGKNILLVYSKISVNDKAIEELELLARYLGIDAANLDDLTLDNRLNYKSESYEVIYAWFEHHRVSKAVMDKIKKLIRNQKIVLVNDFLGSLLGDKRFLAFLVSDDFHKFINMKQLRLIKKILIPSALLLESNKKLIKANKDKYVLKSALGTEGKEIIIGKSCSEKKWPDMIDRCRDNEWIVQEYFNLPKGKLKFLLDQKIIEEERIFDFDPYFVDGKISGLLCRTSTNYITNYNAGGLLASLLVEK